MSPRLLLVALAALLAAAPAAAQSRSAECVNGFAVVPDLGSFPCSNVELLSILTPSQFAIPGSPAAPHNDLWGWTDPQTGTEYALVGAENAVGFVDLSDPAAPRLVGKLPSSNGRSSTWRDVKVYLNHAFVVADGAADHGVQVFDLTRLRGATGDPVVFTADTVYRGIRSAHNVVVNEATGFAYAVGFRYPVGERANLGLPPECDLPGFHAIDVRDPQNPTFAGCFSDAAIETGPRSPGYTHDAQCVIYAGPDADYSGRELCFAANEDVVTVFDATDKADVQIVSQAAYPAFAYTHQGWLSADQRYFLANDELDEANQFVTAQRTIVFDFLDLDAPEVSFLYDSGIPSIDHNLYVRGRYAFESNYEAGLRILDLDRIDEGTLTEVAYFDTFAPRTAISFNGQWSNYPFFESGNVIVNDGTYGLFVLRPSAALSVGADGGPDLPAGFALSAPRPNPAAGLTRLSLAVDTAQHVSAALYDVAGRRVTQVFDGTVSAGAPVTLAVDARTVPAGVYILRVVGEVFEGSQRVVLTR